MGDTGSDRASCSWRERGWKGFKNFFFFFEWAVLYSIRFFPLQHLLISKPFAQTVLTANVKLADVLELDTEWDSYKATTSLQLCVSGVTPTRCQSRASSCSSWCNAPFSRAVWGTGCSSEPGLTEHSHHIQAQSEHNRHVNENSCRLCFLLSLRKTVTPHYKTDVVIKLIRSNTVSEEVRKHSKWCFSAEI